MDQPQRIVSLLPATTEILVALGCENQLVGRSHECNYPPAVRALPACTSPKFSADGQSYDINRRVQALLQEGLAIYRVDAQRLAELSPDLIITQDHCQLCAASLDDVLKATRQCLDSSVDICSISPTSLDEVFTSITKIARAVGRAAAGRALRQSMQDDFDSIRRQSNHHPKPTLLCLEWLDPLMAAGNWVPELAEVANCDPLAAPAGNHSPVISWSDVRQLNPEVLCIMPCGYDIEQTKNEMTSLSDRPGWDKLQCVQTGRVFIADGDQYFNRPGPRLTRSARILCEITQLREPTSCTGNGWISFPRS